MARTGYKIYICLDDNPNSPTYMQTYTERVEDQTDCPVEVDDLILVSNECEVTLTGRTGYRILIYYNRGTGEYTEVREEDEECIPSSTDEQWVASGNPYCETTTAGTNTGYMIQVEVQKNIELPNYGEIRYDRYKSPECGANDCAVWDEVSRSCHITIDNCATTFDGTADVVQIDVSPLSATYNQTRTVNVEDSDCDNCTESVFSWVLVGDMCGDDSLLCSNGIQQVSTNSYTVSKKYKTIGNGTPIPMDEYQIVLNTEDDEDCGYIPPQYRWDLVPGQYLCDYETYTKYEMLVKMVSYDSGVTWSQVIPTETQRGNVIAYDSYDCGKPMYRWVGTNEFVCIDNGDDWKLKIVRSGSEDVIIPCNESATLVQSEVSGLSSYTDATLIDFGDCISNVNCRLVNQVGDYGNMALVHFGDYVEIIGDGSHGVLPNYCTITDDTFNERLKRINTSAFTNCSYSSHTLYLGSEIEYIGERAFFGSSNGALATVVIDAIVPPQIGYFAFLDVARSSSKNYHSVVSGIKVPSGSVASYQTSWYSYSQYIFSDGEENTFFRLVFPNNVKGWNISAEGRNGVLDKYIAHMTYKGLGLRDAVDIELGEGITSIANETFRNFYNSGVDGVLNISGITMPSTLQSIGTSAFTSQSGITYVDMSSCTGLTSIGNSAFKGDESLTSVTIPNSVQSIGEYAFGYCSGLTTVNIPTSLTSLGEWAFYDCSSLTGSVVIPTGVTSIGENTFNGCSGITSVSVLGNVSSIGVGAFRGCTSITSLTIPHTVSIGAYAFKDCTRITGDLSFGGVGAEIGQYAFNYCSGLTSLEISDFSLIDEFAFASCTRLTSATLNCSSNAAIGGFAFAASSGLTQITIGSGCTKIYDEAFRGVRRGSGDGDVPFYDIAIYVYAITPPELYNYGFPIKGPFTYQNGGVYKWIPTVYVPSSALSAYQASQWNNICRLEAMP